MACFLVPTAEAVVTAIVSKSIKTKEVKTKVEGQNVKISFSKKLHWLSNMLWGGSALLAFEHIWHGEIVPYFPFLTAMNNPDDTYAMLWEISTRGVAMAIAITTVWAAILVLSHFLEKHKSTTFTCTVQCHKKGDF